MTADVDVWTCISCHATRPAAEMQSARRIDWSVIAGSFVCRDRDACYDAFMQIPIEELR